LPGTGTAEAYLTQGRDESEHSRLVKGLKMSIENVLASMWQDYLLLNPEAQRVVDTLRAEGESIVNDHIALRTFNVGLVALEECAKPFIAMGYEEKDEYCFEAKKLRAKHYEFKGDPSTPKIFISELLVNEFSSEFQTIVNSLVSRISADQVQRSNFFHSGRLWNVSLSQYETLLKESDYGAWMAAIGYRPNHFTVSINNLKKYSNIQTLNDFLKSKGFKLNSSGGEIKGGPDVLLEQSSTLANRVEVEFTDGKKEVPSCYFEFAKRYPIVSGELYQGFIAKSADKIFESTNT
jgi:hypothetical protein